MAASDRVVRVLADTPIRSGYLEALAGISGPLGAWARAGLAVRPTENQALYLGAKASQLEGWGLEAGWRWEFDF